MSPEIDFGHDIDTPIEGLTSILTHLGYLQMRLRVPPAHHLRQLQTDLETLLSTLERMAVSQGCPLPNPGSNLHKDEAAFPITSNYLCLLELQWYLEKLCLNLDKLKTCWMLDHSSECVKLADSMEAQIHTHTHCHKLTYIQYMCIHMQACHLQ